MAGFDMSNVGNVASGIGAGLGTLLMWIAGLALVGGVVWWWLYNKGFNKNVMLLKIVGTGYSPIFDKARIKKDRNGVSFWKCKATKLMLSVPPSNCIMSSFGGDFALGYVNSVGEVLWAEPGYKPGEIQEKIKLREEAAKKGEPLVPLSEFDQKVEDFIKSHRPVSTTERALYAYQQEEAKKHLLKDFLKDNLTMIIGGVFIFLIFAIFLILGPKFVQEYRLLAAEMGNQVKAFNDQHLEEMRILQDIYGRTQRIESSLNITNEGVGVG